MPPPRKTFHKNQVIPPKIPCSKLRRGSCGCVECGGKTLNYRTKDEELPRDPSDFQNEQNQAQTGQPTQQAPQQPTQPRQETTQVQSRPSGSIDPQRQAAHPDADRAVQRQQQWQQPIQPQPSQQAQPTQQSTQQSTQQGVQGQTPSQIQAQGQLGQTQAQAPVQAQGQPQAQVQPQSTPVQQYHQQGTTQTSAPLSDEQRQLFAISRIEEAKKPGSKEQSILTAIKVSPAARPILPQNTNRLANPDQTNEQVDAYAVQLFQTRDLEALPAAMNVIDGGSYSYYWSERLKKIDSESGIAGVYEANRTFGRDSNGRLYAHNDLFITPEGSPLKGLGAMLFVNQVRGLRSLGAAYIETLAAGDFNRSFEKDASGQEWSGYNVWPKLGYDGPLLNYIMRKLPGSYYDVLSDAAYRSGVRPTVQDLLSLPGGPEVWELYGQALDLTFDLANNSSSMQLLQRYMDKRQSAGGQRAVKDRGTRQERFNYLSSVIARKMREL